jgi:beta-galactosidase
MKKAILLIMSFWAVTLFSQIPEEIQNEKIIGINKLPARTMIWPSPDISHAKISDYDQSFWVKSLNGQWQFHWSPNPQSRPVDFYKPEYSVDSWSTIELPTTLEAIGYGTPIYTNEIYPFNVSNPPFCDGNTR